MTTIWNVIITRRRKINRLKMDFDDYTDWLSENSSRITPITFGNYILECQNDLPIMTVDGQEIEGVKNEHTNS